LNVSGSLCLEELGYVHLDPRGAELLFQIITEREEKASIARASNAPFSEWGPTFTDPRLAAAVVDRLTFHAHIIETGTTSYRLRTTRAARTTPTTRSTTSEAIKHGGPLQASEVGPGRVDISTLPGPALTARHLTANPRSGVGCSDRYTHWPPPGAQGYGSLSMGLKSCCRHSCGCSARTTPTP
jgi:hypothetical protein